MSFDWFCFNSVSFNSLRPFNVTSLCKNIYHPSLCLVASDRVDDWNYSDFLSATLILTGINRWSETRNTLALCDLLFWTFTNAKWWNDNIAVFRIAAKRMRSSSLFLWSEFSPLIYFARRCSRTFGFLLSEMRSHEKWETVCEFLCRLFYPRDGMAL